MGKILCKICCCCSCLCRCCNGNPQNSVGVLPDEKLKFLLLGLDGSGKTEIAHCLTQSQRLDYEPTNGVHSYIMKCMEATCSLTEIGGNEDIQKIWHHYYVGTMGIIYCFDLSSKYEYLKHSFQLLNKIIKESYVAGKPILLVATKADIADESIQLYDIENTFHLKGMAASSGCPFKLCVYDPRTENISSSTNLKSGMDWFVRYTLDNFDIIQMRLNCDKNMKTWESHRDQLVTEGKLNLGLYKRFPKPSSRHKFWRYSHRRLRRSLIRPRTAPPKLSFVSNVKQSFKHKLPTSQMSLEDISKVPNGVLPKDEEITKL